MSIDCLLQKRAERMAQLENRLARAEAILRAIIEECDDPFLTDLRDIRITDPFHEVRRLAKEGLE
jgi:hypothetical protein